MAARKRNPRNTKLDIPFQNSNLRIVGAGMDTNGNSVIRFQIGSHRAFSKQAHSIKSARTKRDLMGWGTLSDYELAQLEKRVVASIKAHGSAAQKKSLRVYKREDWDKFPRKRNSKKAPGRRKNARRYASEMTTQEKVELVVYWLREMREAGMSEVKVAQLAGNTGLNVSDLTDILTIRLGYTIEPIKGDRRGKVFFGHGHTSNPVDWRGAGRKAWGGAKGAAAKAAHGAKVALAKTKVKSAESKIKSLKACAVDLDVFPSELASTKSMKAAQRSLTTAKDDVKRIQAAKPKAEEEDVSLYLYENPRKPTGIIGKSEGWVRQQDGSYYNPPFYVVKERGKLKTTPGYKPRSVVWNLYEFSSNNWNLMGSHRTLTDAKRQAGSDYSYWNPKKGNPRKKAPTRRTNAQKPRLKKGDQVTMTGRRWFDSFGNTYHTVRVAVLPKGSKRWLEVGESPITYGYGDHYLETGRKILDKKYYMPQGWKKRKRRALWELRDFGVTLHSNVYDVKRKRDL